MYVFFFTHSASDPNNSDALAEMIAYAQDLTSEQALSVMRIFSIALNLVNSAEVAHRLRVTRDHEMKADRNAHVGPLPMLEDSMRGTIENILDVVLLHLAIPPRARHLRRPTHPNLLPRRRVGSHLHDGAYLVSSR